MHPSIPPSLQASTYPCYLSNPPSIYPSICLHGRPSLFSTCPSLCYLCFRMMMAAVLVVAPHGNDAYRESCLPSSIHGNILFSPFLPLFRPTCMHVACSSWMARMDMNDTLRICRSFAWRRSSNIKAASRRFVNTYTYGQYVHVRMDVCANDVWGMCLRLLAAMWHMLCV